MNSLNNESPRPVNELLGEEFGFNEEVVNRGENTQESMKTHEEYSVYDFDECSPDDILEVIGQTVKKDDSNKLLVFLCQLLAFTEDSQINVSFNAPSSSGKSYLALEIAELFPVEDVIKLGYASPTSFFHTTSKYDKERKGFVVDLERKILIFLDMPHSSLLQHLRPLLSHDEKEIMVKITDKNKKGGIKTKDIYIRGYPSVLFCTASFNLDEQELTRFILLSPETNQEKLRAAIYEKIKKESDREAYYKTLEENSKRQELKKRIRAIKAASIKEIKLGNPEKLSQMFYERNKILKPRHTRDIQRISSLTKAFALLNFWKREKRDEAIITNDSDLENSFKVWDEISIAQDLGVSPYILNLYKEVVVPAYEDKGKIGITREEIFKKHYEVYGRHLPDWQLRQEIVPMMKSAGLISEDRDPLDKRKILIYPLVQLTISPDDLNKNSELEGGLSTKSEQKQLDNIKASAVVTIVSHEDLTPTEKYYADLADKNDL